MKRIALLTALTLAAPALSQTAVPHLPRGSAAGIPNRDIETAMQKTASMPVSDQQLRVVNVNGEYNVGVAVVHRAKTEGREIGSGAEHSQMAEIYHVISGRGTLVTGGTLDDVKETSNTLTGPTALGSILNGRARNVGPGDVVIIPPNTPHQFTEITNDIVYLVVRVDPNKVLPLAQERTP